jgi:hypothetical protein
MREHRARGYRNVHSHDELLRVSPELFASTADPDVTIESPESPSREQTTDWRAVDRRRGATNGLLAASNDGETLAVAAAALGAVALPSQVSIPGWLLGALIRDAALPAERLNTHDSAERVLFEAVSRVLGERDAGEAWSPSEVLDAVCATVIESKPDEAVASMVERNLDRVRELINVEREFEPFRPTGNALVSAKALILALLRIDLTELLAWPREETGADDITRATAAMYAGRLRGIARESVELRSLALDDVTAECAVRRARGSDESIGAVTFSADQSGTSMSIDDVRVAESLPLTPDPVSIYDSLDAALQPDARVAVARTLGWPVVVQIVLPADADFVRDGRSIRVTSSDIVEIESLVDEESFAARLRAATGDVRRRASDALLSLTTSTSGQPVVEAGGGTT